MFNDTDKDAALSLADALPAALEAETGKPWAAEKTLDRDRAEDLLFVTLTEDGGAGSPSIIMGGGNWNENGKARFYISVPDDVDGGRRAWGYLPGVEYGTPVPETAAALTRPAKTVARQIVRRVLTPENRAILTRSAEHDAATQGVRNDAETWREKVAGAAGIPCRINGDRAAVLWGNGYGSRDWGKIDSSFHCPGGSVKIALSDDPEQAATLVAKIRAAVEAHEKELNQ
jgi:hypothetical protein